MIQTTEHRAQSRGKTHIIQIFWNDIGNELGAVGGNLAGLDHHTVSGGDGGSHWHEQQLQRVVPGADHQNHSEGVIVDLDVVHHVHKRLGRLAGQKARKRSIKEIEHNNV